MLTDTMAIGAMFTAMRHSVFLSDLTDGDRDVRRLLVAVPVGMLAAVVAALLGAVSACLLVMVVVSGLDGAPAAAGLFSVFDQPGRATTEGLASLFVLAVLAGANGAAAVAFVAVGAGISHRSIRRYVTLASAFRTRLLVAGLLLISATMIGLILLAMALGVEAPQPPVLTLASTAVGRSTYAGFAIVLLIIAAAAEELVFRGWLLKHLGAYVRHPAVLMLVNGLLFAAIHFDPAPDAFLVRAAMGAGLTWMTLRTGGIEMAIGAHAANNIVVLLLLQPLSLTPPPPQPFQLTALVSMTAIGLGYAALAEAVVRWPQIRRWIGERRAAAQT